MLLSKALAFGDTPTGQAWCLKALHPSDAVVTSSGIPDLTSVPSVVQNFSQTYNLMNPLAGQNDGNWDADVFFYPHPVFLGAVRTVDAAGTVAWSPILNAQINGATAAEKCATFATLCERYRLTYLGVTGYQNSSALSNQGLCAVAQYMDTPGYVSLPSTVPGMLGWLHEVWVTGPRTFTQLQTMPNAFLGAAREGMYAPFRMSETSQDWQVPGDLVVHENNQNSAGFVQDHVLPVSAPAPNYPYALSGSYYTAAGVLNQGVRTFRRSDTGMIHVSLQALSADASMMFYIRNGWETQILPGSTLTGFAQSSPVSDPRALASYFAISRELKDAYPAEYNDLGTLMKTIRDAASEVLPIIGKFSGMPILGSAAGKLVGSIGTGERRRKAKPGETVLPHSDGKSASRLNREKQALLNPAPPNWRMAERHMRQNAAPKGKSKRGQKGSRRR